MLAGTCVQISQDLIKRPTNSLWSLWNIPAAAPILPLFTHASPRSITPTRNISTHTVRTPMLWKPYAPPFPNMTCIVCPRASKTGDNRTQVLHSISPAHLSPTGAHHCTLNGLSIKDDDSPLCVHGEAGDVKALGTQAQSICWPSRCSEFSSRTGCRLCCLLPTLQMTQMSAFRWCECESD